MSDSYDKFILKFKFLHYGNEAGICSCLARDDSGPLKTPFLNMLMLEDTIAYAQTSSGICSSASALTMDRFIDLADMIATKLMEIITSFPNLNAFIFADYLDHDVSSTLYQQVDPV